MKKINQYKFIAGVFAVSLLASCNYEEINTNPFELTDEEGVMDGVAVGGLITTIERTVFPVGTQADDTDIINSIKQTITYRLTAGVVSSDRIIHGEAETVTLPIS